MARPVSPSCYIKRLFGTSERAFGTSGPATRVHNGAVPSPDREPISRPGGSTQRQHILSTALTLMAQQGVDGTSMRNLAAATGLNVASLYHYFPSKRDLLVAVLEERGFVDNPAVASQPSLSRDPASGLADLLNDVLSSMLEVEDFVRLMMGEVMRGDDTAFAVGEDLFAATQASLEHWLAEHRPPLCPPDDQAAMARMLRSLLVGMFFEHVAGVLDSGSSPAAVFRTRAEEVATLLEGGRRP
jgi:AcrR family transcriptional regulator